MATLKPKTEWLRAGVAGKTVGVDREQEIIRGYVVAQEGPFKTEGRGEFDKLALREIVRLMKATANGLKSRFAHPSLSDDGVGKFLGRARNPRLDKITTPDVRQEELTVVRADLHLDPTSRSTPGGDLGGYVMDLAESDPAALSSSLVLSKQEEYRIDKKGRPLKDDEGNELPPLWRPLRLHASDVVDDGDAVDGFLSAQALQGLPDAVVRQAAELLNHQFPDATRVMIHERCLGWLDRYLNYRFAEKHKPAEPSVSVTAQTVRFTDAKPLTVTLDLDSTEFDKKLSEVKKRLGYDPALDAEKILIRRKKKARLEGIAKE